MTIVVLYLYINAIAKNVSVCENVLLGYRDWSKQRLLRKLLEVEKVRGNHYCPCKHTGVICVTLLVKRLKLHQKFTPISTNQRLEDSRRHALAANNSGRLDQEVRATPTEFQGFTMATEAVVSVGTMTGDRQEISDLRGRLSRVEKDKVELQEKLSSKE